MTTTAAKSLEIGTRRQLFVDDYLIDETSAVTRNLNQPIKYTGNPVMIPLYPWEGSLWLYGDVVRDPDGGWKMWYTGPGAGGLPSMSGPDPMDTAEAGYGTLAGGFDLDNLHYVMCYATSKDGIFWERPNVGLVEYNGSKDNNVVLDDACPGNIIIDERDPDPDRRYKALFFQIETDVSLLGAGVSVAFSPDGLRWTKHDGNPIIQRSSDFHTLFGWDDLHETYVAYCRPTTQEGNKTRRIGRATSDDFVNWTEIEEVLVPDDDDPPATELYGMPVFKYEDMYLGQLQVLHPPPEEPQTRNANTLAVQLTSSRDGISWERVADRKEFIPNGPPGSTDQGEVSTAGRPTVIGDELWFYYSATAEDHSVIGSSGPICLAKLRQDGFVSVDAGDESGTLITKPFRCEGGRLSINTAAKGGMVGIAVVDESGTQFQGYSRQECALFDGDSVRHTMTWREKGSLEELKGRDIRLKFYIRNASLFSFVVDWLGATHERR